jgi:hypothetical protein
MKIPKTINILGVEFKVYFTNNIKKFIKKYEPPDDDVDMVGYCSTRYSVIILAKDMGKQTTESVFLHEVIEAINDMLELKLKHDNIDRLEAAIYQIFKQNKIW